MSPVSNWSFLLHTLKEVLVDLLSFFSWNKHDYYTIIDINRVSKVSVIKKSA